VHIGDFVSLSGTLSFEKSSSVTLPLSGGGSATFLGYRPRDDQSCSLGYETRNWFEVLHAIVRNGRTPVLFAAIDEGDVEELGDIAWCGGIAWLLLDCGDGVRRERLLRREGWSAAMIDDALADAVALRVAVQLNPNSVYPHFELATALFQQKNYRAAAESFGKVIGLEPKYAPAYRCLGRCWMMQGNRADAIRAYQAAVQCMPQDAETHRELGRLLIQDGQVAEGQVQLRHALQLRPGDAQAKVILDEGSKRAP